MPLDQRRQELRSIARFQVTKGQYVIAFLALFSILALGFSSLTESNATIRQSSMLSNVETPAASIIFTQRETLVYATRLAQWSNGGTTRRSVQISRNLLAQRLAVIDTSGRSMGSRAKYSYWQALKKTDAIVASAPAGVLPEYLHKKINREISPIIDEILAEARQLVVSYQRSVDAEMISDAKDVARRDQISLILFYSSLFFGGLFMFLNVLTNFRNYRRAGEILDDEQRRLESAISELQQSQSTVTELQNLNDAKNAFIATVNHELRTPLTSIIGYIDIIRDETPAENQEKTRQYLDVLDRNAQILLNLVESMLTLSRIDGDATVLSTEKVWLNEVIDNAIFTMKPQAIKSKISLTIDSDDEYFVEGDAGQLTQVFINLIGNAVKFSPQESAVEVSIRSTRNDFGGDSARVEIKDSGIGIPPEDIEHLFTRFFRAKNAVSEHFQGTGLGLSIVSQVLEKHNGSIGVISTQGVGTTFTIDIPLFLTSEEKMIRDRRADVLARAITSLENATAATIKAVTHEIGGAIGFYGFASLGSDILEYSRTLTDNRAPSEDEFAAARNYHLAQLKSEAEKVAGGLDG